ncbi:hypothetical protein HPB49_000999 [Dermacentor silvarum]|uniref:Uncharacterized protein n=1 Tax=Dermacentor silvarum TaxID=543639 RepID=A0ACB8DM50_DERSI|nr:hypothetical protein HPB49_000999 [Dermacentor silvarum]
MNSVVTRSFGVLRNYDNERVHLRVLDLCRGHFQFSFSSRIHEGTLSRDSAGSACTAAAAASPLVQRQRTGAAAHKARSPPRQSKGKEEQRLRRGGVAGFMVGEPKIVDRWLLLTGDAEYGPIGRVQLQDAERLLARPLGEARAQVHGRDVRAERAVPGASGGEASSAAGRREQRRHRALRRRRWRRPRAGHQAVRPAARPGLGQLCALTSRTLRPH